MDTLIKKLEDIKKAIDAIPTIKSPKPPSSPALDSLEAPKAPKAGAASSKKDPVKAAQQLKDPEKGPAVEQAKKLKEGVKINHNGQWTIS